MKPFHQKGYSQYGASMGRRSENLSGKVHLARVPLYGDYDPGGAYWGNGTPLYCAWNEEGAAYVRAVNRNEAKQNFPDCIFYR